MEKMTIFGNCSVMKPKLYFARLIKDIAVGRMEEWRNGGTEEWNVGRMEEWESGMLRRWPKSCVGGRKMEVLLKI